MWKSGAPRLHAGLADDTIRQAEASDGSPMRFMWILACLYNVADVCLVMKPIGKPNAGKLHVRFDLARRGNGVHMNAPPRRLIGFYVDVHQCAQSRRELRSASNGAGCRLPRKLPSATARFGFWKAFDEVCPETRHQRRWVHKIVNVLDKVSVQANMKTDLHEVYPPNDGRRSGDRLLCREIPGQIRAANRMSGQGSRRTANLLRLPCRTLGLLAHDQPHRACSPPCGTGGCARGLFSPTTAKLMVSSW